MNSYKIILSSLLLVVFSSFLFLTGCTDTDENLNGCEGTKVIFEGTNSCVEEDNINTCTPEQKQADSCTMQYDPVCGNDGKTHSNSCVACTEGVDSWIKGECPE